jgi:hypothetical protein
MAKYPAGSGREGPPGRRSDAGPRAINEREPGSALENRSWMANSPGAGIAAAERGTADEVVEGATVGGEAGGVGATDGRGA